MDEAMRRALEAALALQLAWGADEALDETPRDRRRASSPEAMRATLPAAAVPESPAPPSPIAPTALATSPHALPSPGGAVAEAERLAAAAADLESLRRAIAEFGGLALRETATNLVFADGNPAAPVMLIGEAPGAEEDRAGKPFVGASGRLLDRMMASIGLDRHGTGWGSFYVTNIITWRPPGNRNPTDGEVALSLPFLRRHVVLVQPKLLLLLGAVAVRSLTGAREGITRLRGRWLTLEFDGLGSVPALATLHPAYLLRNPGAKKDAWADLIALRRRIDDLRQD
ncbi:uracil-DNA glycosylase [Elioraea tepida]|uniref:uracil-DNA glycosylase n=2 Tax=Elioraea tepida TaxID=2843330 RepID=A0A975U1T0_9PROT|nr:uracil-DNA glycosylase [Elioraea tepida]